MQGFAFECENALSVHNTISHLWKFGMITYAQCRWDRSSNCVRTPCRKSWHDYGGVCLPRNKMASGTMTGNPVFCTHFAADIRKSALEGKRVFMRICLWVRACINTYSCICAQAGNTGEGKWSSVEANGGKTSLGIRGRFHCLHLCKQGICWGSAVLHR